LQKQNTKVLQIKALKTGTVTAFVLNTCPRASPAARLYF
jgi:hypothetical protein